MVERNPAWTSAACPHGSHLGERFSLDGRGYPSRFRCVHCGGTGDANVVAAWNLKRKWDRTFQYPTQQEAAEARRRRKGGVAASRESPPEMVGANVGGATDAPRAFCPCRLHGKGQAAVVGLVLVLCECAKGPRARGIGRFLIACRPDASAKGSTPPPQGEKEPRATGASRIGAARTTYVLICCANRAAVDTTQTFQVYGRVDDLGRYRMERAGALRIQGTNPRAHGGPRNPYLGSRWGGVTEVCSIPSECVCHAEGCHYVQPNREVPHSESWGAVPECVPHRAASASALRFATCSAEAFPTPTLMRMAVVVSVALSAT